MRYEIINANTKEKNIIDTIMRYIESSFSDTYNYNKLKQIEVVNSLSGGSTARTIKDRILVAQENGLELVQQQEITFDDISKIKEINCQTAHCGRHKPHFDFGDFASSIAQSCR